MCRQCASGNYHQCLGVVYSYTLHEFRECVTQREDSDATV